MGARGRRGRHRPEPVPGCGPGRRVAPRRGDGRQRHVEAGGVSADKSNGRRGLPVEILTEDEVKAVIGACLTKHPTGVRNRALIAVLYRSGLRISEALALRRPPMKGTLNIATARRLATPGRDGRGCVRVRVRAVVAGAPSRAQVAGQAPMVAWPSSDRARRLSPTSGSSSSSTLGSPAARMCSAPLMEGSRPRVLRPVPAAEPRAPRRPASRQAGARARPQTHARAYELLQGRRAARRHPRAARTRLARGHPPPPRRHRARRADRPRAAAAAGANTNDVSANQRATVGRRVSPRPVLRPHPPRALALRATRARHRDQNAAR